MKKFLSIFFQSFVFRIKKAKIAKRITRARFKNPPPLEGEPQKLKKGSKEKIVAKKKTAK